MWRAAAFRLLGFPEIKSALPLDRRVSVTGEASLGRPEIPKDYALVIRKHGLRDLGRGCDTHSSPPSDATMPSRLTMSSNAYWRVTTPNEPRSASKRSKRAAFEPVRAHASPDAMLIA